MKSTLGLLSIVGLCLLILSSVAGTESKTKKHRIVLEVTRDGTDQWNGVLNNVENVQKAFGAGQTQIEVVAHGNALGFLLTSNRVMQERMKSMADAGVVFAACQNTMNRKNVTEKDLMPFVTTVDSGVAEVVRKQEDGWSYIKSGS
ncbi:MAG: DsrE family protein [Bacillota bacterium]